MSLFAPDAEQAELASTARSLLGRFVDNAYLNEQQESETGHEPERWRRFVDLGWTGVHLPSRIGGADGTLADAALLTRELGRAAYAGPLLSTLRASTALMVLGAGGADDKTYDDVLGQVAEGAPLALVAPPDRPLRATVEDGGLRLAGEPCLVEWFDASEVVVCVLPGEDDTWVVAVVARELLGPSAVDVASIDNERVSRLDLDGVLLPAETVRAVGVDPLVVRRALSAADLLRASSMVGGSQEVVERTARYALERHQFGKPIGGFQAVRHHLARMVIATDGARLLCDDAVTRVLAAERGGGDESAIAAAALFAAGRAYVQVVLTAAQVHGGVGTTVEHVLHHHFRRAKAMQLRSGRRANRLREMHQSLVVDRAARPGSLW